MKRFFAGLSHSARVTVITCGCFVLLTMLILIFLMLCPIHQSSAANDVNNALVVTTGATEQTTETTVTTMSFTRKTTNVNRLTTTTEAATPEDNTPNDSEPYYNYNQTKPTYHYTTKPYVNTTAPAATEPVTQAPVVTDSPVPAVTDPPQETLSATIPAPDDNVGGDEAAE